MRIRPLLFLAIAAGAATAFSQQALVCPPAAAVTANSCESYHYHILTFRPDTRKFFEATATAGFANQASCDRAREDTVRRNLAVVDYFKRVKGEQQYEPDRTGPCHCDMTAEKANAAFLTEAQRQAQVRTIEDIRLRVREKLLDSGMTSDSELVRSLIAPRPTVAILGGPKLAPLPPATAAAVAPASADDLRPTAAVETRAPSSAALDLPLVDVAVGAASPLPVPAPAPATAVTAASTAPGSVQPPPALPPAVQEATIAAPEGDRPAEGAAEEFITYETDRIQSVLKAASAISDENEKARIIEASLQRNQLLSNLRALIEGSGERSRLATAVRGAKTEEDHIALARTLFGSTVSQRWAPKDAADIVLPAQPDVDAEPERVLRDRTGRFDEQQKKRALYDILSRSQPTDEQQLWLGGVIDTFLRQEIP